MAKDYFEDIVPPENSGSKEPASEPASGERSIRNIVVTNRVSDRREVPQRTNSLSPQRFPKKISSKWLWSIAAIGVFVVAVLLLLSFQATTVAVTPRSHVVVFDASSVFTAYPATGAATGTLSYTVATFDLTDSELVPSQGTKQVDHKASGSITIFNQFSSAPVKLVKNTRFSSPAGLVFRIPADVVVPGMKSSNTPGKISVTVVADKPGSDYNIGPTTRFKIPGLASKPAMYASVYGKTDAAMTGGSSGSELGVAPSDLDAATTKIVTRLESAIASKIASMSASSSLSRDLAKKEYEDVPNAPEQSQVRIGKKVHVTFPLIDPDALGRAVATTVSADSGQTAVRLIPADSFKAQKADGDSVSLGSDSLAILLSGSANLIWEVDAHSVAQALAGKNQSTFQSVIDGFASIQEARARIEPFWQTSFPSDASKIHIQIVDVAHHAKS